ncbi:MAG: metallophosphoesterase [Clostridia bacterium]|nr:metallophosphoesterase [Clostridia bacterium]
MNAVYTPTAAFRGCDAVVRLDAARQNTPVRILQLTDMQFIDAAQRRTPDRLRGDEIVAWAPDQLMAQCGNQIKSLVAQTKPDLIFLTGDLVYGSFDDSGAVFSWFCDFMDGFGVPLAPVFGNHDNETARGVDWQCEKFAACEHCLFVRGEVSGNGNYTVGIAVGNTLVRVLHMVDSNGCADCTDPAVIRQAGIYPDQLALFAQNAASIGEAQGKDVPAFMAFHIPTTDFLAAAQEKGYVVDTHTDYTIGVDVTAKDGDFGFCYERFGAIRPADDFMGYLREIAVDGVFVGHCHRIATCVNHHGVRLVFGLKTGQYDYHLAGSLGGTLITLDGDDFTVSHIPAAVPLAPMPHGARFLQDFFVKD